jgi:hypothetical protein
MNRAVIHIDASLLHHLFYIVVTQGISQVPVDAPQIHFLFEIPAAQGNHRQVCYTVNRQILQTYAGCDRTV